MKYGLFYRLLLSLVLLFLISASLMAYMLLNEAKNSIEESRLQQAHTLASGLAEGSLDALVVKDYELLERWLKASTPIDDFAYAYLSKSDGLIITHTEPELVARKTHPLGEIKARLVRDITYSNRPVREVVHAAYLANKHMANAHLGYYVDTKPFYSEHIVIRLTVLLIISVLTLSLATFVILRWMLKPIENLAQVIEQTANYQPDLSDELLEREDEVGLLARNFDSLMLRLFSSYNELFEEKESTQVTLDSIAEAVIVIDDNCCIQYMNKAAEQMTGWQLQDAYTLPMTDIFQLIESDSKTDVSDCVYRDFDKPGTIHSAKNKLLISSNGSEHWIQESASTLQNRDNEIFGVVLVLNDITKHKRAEDRIRTLSQVVEQSPVSVMITDTNANIEYVNSNFELKTGYSLAEVIGKNPRILKSGQTPKNVYHNLWQTITSGNVWQGEIMNRKKNGEFFWESAHISPVLDQSGAIVHYLAISEDISLRKKQEEKIVHQAHFDALTNLPNRFLSLDRLSQLINEASRNNEMVAVLFLDLDDFKKINDTLGHDMGDKLLVKAAGRLEDEVRSGDTVGRLGGDEFIVLLGGLENAADASPIVENLLNRFRDAFQVKGRELILTASVGIALYPNDGDSPSDLLRNADSAMYHSKEQGRNTYSYFSASMNQNVTRRLALEEQMHGALNRNEFRLCYQPKVDISSGNIMGVEALLRWSNPVLGEVTPEEFVPIAEQTGLIMPIGQFVLSKAIEMIADWQQKYKQSLTMAVNLSPRQFRDPNLVALIKATLTEFGVAGKSLELEITEGVLLSGHTHVDNALINMNELGVCITMDDFGTGYSSLSYLRRYPFDVLKIDRSFINDITEDEADCALVNATIVMAHSLGLKVVAEGVETEEQLTLLGEQGCDIAQGYFFSPPVLADEITKMLATDINTNHDQDM